MAERRNTRTRRRRDEEELAQDMDEELAEEPGDEIAPDADEEPNDEFVMNADEDEIAEEEYRQADGNDGRSAGVIAEALPTCEPVLGRPVRLGKRQGIHSVILCGVVRVYGRPTPTTIHGNVDSP